VDLPFAADVTGEATADVLIGTSEYDSSGPADRARSSSGRPPR
jgi:hypothetical protein